MKSMNPPPDFPVDAVTTLARTAFREDGPVVVTAMPGGASTRRFARVTVPSGKTAVAIYVPEANRSDEIVKDHAPTQRWPFLEVRDLLASRGIRVPSVHAEACDEGLLLVEDLGELTLAVALEMHPEKRPDFYRRAVQDLARAQQALSSLPEDCIVRSRCFDHDLLLWEVDHFRQWALDARGIQLTAAESEVFGQAARFLATHIAAIAPSFVHRDYQSRNIMVRFDLQGDFELVWIDFQDALLGPRTYDLVALLGDSYQVFDRAFVDEMLDEYARSSTIGDPSPERLAYEFDLVTVQRKLKDAGRFVFIDRVKGNPSFLNFVEPTVDKVMLALRRLRAEPTLARLEEVLGSRLGRS